MHQLDIPLFPLIATVLGLILGSFYNVCVHRYVSLESIVRPRSKCPKCGHQLAWWENIPLLSYIILRGRCRSCKETISPRYPAVELISGLWALALALKFGAGPVFAFYMVIGGILIVASFIDFQLYILPDILTLPGAAVAFAGAYFILLPALGRPSLLDSIIGALAGAGVFLLLQQLYRRLKGIEGLGTGDIKLMLLLGAMLGWQALPLMVTAAAVAALVASLFYLLKPGSAALQTMVPFGPFLSFGGMIYVLYGDAAQRMLAGL